VRNAFSEALYACAKDDPRIMIVVADISPAGNMAKFREEYPDRFINVGVAEQVMIGICAGLALRGQRPFAYTIATFTLFRPFEMVRVDLCYQNLPVTVVGMGSGIVYSTLGGTHHTMEDVAIASALPNMQIICPCDPLEVIDAVKYCATRSESPVYLKLGKAGEPRVTESAIDPFRFGQIRYLQRGSDLCILTYGGIIKKALDVAAAVQARGRTASVVSVHTLKPLDREGIATALHAHRRVLVVEEHVPHGGLASRVKEIAWDTNAHCKIDTFTLKDQFIHCYGSQDDLLAAHGITTERMIEAVL
jgi:transketolase